MKTLQKYPCISCNQEVTQRQEGLLCEGCNRWQHRTCNTGVTRQQYRNAIRTNCDIVWQCTQCSIPEEPNPEEPNFEESGPDFSSDDDVPDPEEPNIEDSDLDEPNFEESGPDFGSDDDEEQNSDKPDSSDELPSVHQPGVLHESLLDDPAPLAELPQDGFQTTREHYLRRPRPGTWTVLSSSSENPSNSFTPYMPSLPTALLPNKFHCYLYL